MTAQEDRPGAGEATGEHVGGAVVSPPSLNQDTGRSASRLELFFDLAFVLVVARIADRLAVEITWPAVTSATALLVLAWWAWASSTLYANRFDTDDVVFRLSKLAGMLAVIGLAASVTDLSSTNGRWFAGCYAVLRLLLAAQYARAWRHVPESRPTVHAYLAAHTAAGILWLVAVFLPAPVRFWVWAVALLVDLSAPYRSTRSGRTVPLHLEHLPERYALFVILVLGESVTAVVTALEHVRWALPAVAVGALGFVLAAALWWAYFDLSGPAAKEGLLRAGEDGRTGVYDRYLYAHLPVAVALAWTGVGIELVGSHSGEPVVAAAERWLLAGGIGLFLLSIAALQGLMTGRGQAVFPAAGAPLVLLLAAWPVGPLLFVGGLTAVVLAVILVGHRQQRGRKLPAAPV